MRPAGLSLIPLGLRTHRPLPPLFSLKTNSSQASTLGSLEALLQFLKTEKIPVSAVSIGPVHKKDITRCTIQLSRDPKYAVILAFDVPVTKDAQVMAKREGIKIFEADIIYHLEEMFRRHMEVRARTTWPWWMGMRRKWLLCFWHPNCQRGGLRQHDFFS